VIGESARALYAAFVAPPAPPPAPPPEAPVQAPTVLDPM